MFSEKPPEAQRGRQVEQADRHNPHSRTIRECGDIRRDEGEQGDRRERGQNPPQEHGTPVQHIDKPHSPGGFRRRNGYCEGDIREILRFLFENVICSSSYFDQTGSSVSRET